MNTVHTLHLYQTEGPYHRERSMIVVLCWAHRMIRAPRTLNVKVLYGAAVVHFLSTTIITALNCGFVPDIIEALR